MLPQSFLANDYFALYPQKVLLCTVLWVEILSVAGTSLLYNASLYAYTVATNIQE